MIELKNKSLYFSGRGENIDKEELIKYFIQHEAIIVDTVEDANVIIEGYMTPIYLEDKFYILSKNDDITIITIEQIEKEFSLNLDIDSIVMAIKISKDQDRLVRLLKNRYFDGETFIKFLKFYDWKGLDIYEDDENRDVATAITNRFCSLQDINHNIQHSPIGIYYTALETTNGKLLEIIFNMPYFKISDKNSLKDQPLTLKEVVAYNPNTPKSVLMQILVNNNLDELKFLALNESINNMIRKKLLASENEKIIINLIKANNINITDMQELFQNDYYKKELLKNTKLDNDIFDLFIKLNLTEVQKIYLSSNLSLEENHIEILFDFNIDNVNINLLKYKNCPIKRVEEFFEKNDEIYNIAIAHNENLTDDLYLKLEHLNDMNIDVTLSINKNTPKSILKNLYAKNKIELNMGLSENENTPINILMRLQVDNRYTTIISNNETYKEFSRNSLGIIQNDSDRFKRSTYTVN